MHSGCFLPLLTVNQFGGQIRATIITTRRTHPYHLLLKASINLSPFFSLNLLLNMAEAVAILPVEALLSKRVQEMALNDEEPPEPYICRDGNEADQEDVTFEEIEIPTINLSLLSASNGEDTELEKLKLALASWGCFQAIGHGLTSSFLNEIRQVAREFFEQPMEEKRKWAKGVDEFEGYGADPIPADGQPLDWSDRIFLDVYPHDTRKLKLWPETPKSFRGMLEEYTVQTKVLSDLILKAIAKSLNLEENCFLNLYGNQRTLGARFNYYSPCQAFDRVLGLKPHADGSGYTIILQDDKVEGLQILKNGKWITVPAHPDALLILMADQMEIMTNGIFKSPIHRVVTNSERGRISVAMFVTPEPNKEIGPESGLIDDRRPKLYKEVKDYADIHWEYYQQGRRSIHMAQV